MLKAREESDWGRFSSGNPSPAGHQCILGAESASSGSGCLAVLMQASRGEPRLGRPEGLLCRQEPAALLLHRRPGRLTIAAAQVGRVLVDMMGSDRRLDPSHATIAVKARVHIDTVRRALNQLRSAKFVEWTRRLIRTRWRCEHLLRQLNAYAETSNAIQILSRAFLRRSAKRKPC